MSPNPAVLNSLSVAQKVADRYAQLIFEDTGAVLSFLYNPERLAFSRSARNVEAVVIGAPINDQNYLGSSGKRLELSDLLLDSFDAGKSLKPLLEGLESLVLPIESGSAIASPSAGSPAGSPVPFASQRVFFSWGKQRFGPAIVTEISWEETAWLDGEPAAARVNLSLTQVPSVDPVSSANTVEAVAVAERGELTERQQGEGASAALGYLHDSLASLPTTGRLSLQSGRYQIAADELGTVWLTEFNDQVKRVGVWDGFDFVAESAYTEN